MMTCRVEPLQELNSEGIRTLQLDVTSSESINKAVQAILVENNRIDAVICNAGIVRAPMLTYQFMFCTIMVMSLKEGDSDALASLFRLGL